MNDDPQKSDARLGGRRVGRTRAVASGAKGAGGGGGEARQGQGPSPRELNGRDGLDPVRYGDWEVKGLASDF